MPDKAAPIDITPSEPPSLYQDAEPDYSKPAIESSKSRDVQTGYPNVGPWKIDPDPKDWMR